MGLEGVELARDEWELGVRHGCADRLVQLVDELHLAGACFVEAFAFVVALGDPLLEGVEAAVVVEHEKDRGLVEVVLRFESFLEEQGKW